MSELEINYKATKPVKLRFNVLKKLKLEKKELIREQGKNYTFSDVIEEIINERNKLRELLK